VRKNGNSVGATPGATDDSAVPGDTQHFEEVESLRKSLQCNVFEGHRGVGRGRKSLKLIGSSGRTRTYNPSVNRTITSVVSMTYAERLAA
jgi:hypothetical protein